MFKDKNEEEIIKMKINPDNEFEQKIKDTNDNKMMIKMNNLHIKEEWKR